MRRPLDLGNAINDSMVEPNHLCKGCGESYDDWWGEATNPNTGEKIPNDD